MKFEKGGNAKGAVADGGDMSDDYDDMEHLEMHDRAREHRGKLKWNTSARWHDVLRRHQQSASRERRQAGRRRHGMCSSVLHLLGGGISFD